MPPHQADGRDVEAGRAGGQAQKKRPARAGPAPPPPTYARPTRPGVSRTSSSAVLAAEAAAAAARPGTPLACLAASRAAAVRAVESRPWKFGVIFLVLADLAVVLAEVALSGAHPELEACRERPAGARAAAEGLHITTLVLLVLLNAEWALRMCVIGPLHFFREWQHWVDAGLVSLALGLETALHGSAAVTANLGLIILRLARVGHALIELSLAEAHFSQRAARSRVVGLAWRLTAAAAVADARARVGGKGGGGIAVARRPGGGGALNGRGGDL